MKHSCPQWRRISFCYPHGRRAPRRRILDLYFTPSLNLIDFEPQYTTPMHSVLLIDEILEYILEFCSDWSQEEYRQTLACIARCCKAWRDPALDRLWYRLDGVMPLVRLLPGFVAGKDGSDAVAFEDVPCSHADAFLRFRSYASRVRKIKHSAVVGVPPALLPHITLPNLRDVAIASGGCGTAPCWSVSPAVRDVSIVTSYREAASLSADSQDSCLHQRARATADLLDTLRTSDIPLRRLRLRGSITRDTLSSVSLFTTLGTLSLQIGPSLTADVLFSIATTLPSLRELNINAHFVDPWDLQTALSTKSTGKIFSSLKKLVISAHNNTFVALFPFLPSNTLRSLTIHADDADGPLGLIPAFVSLAAAVPASLQELVIECYPDLGDWDEVTPEWFALRMIRPLAGLTYLRRFSVAAIVLPYLGDTDIREISAWWPHLEDLDLGTLTRDISIDQGRGLTPAAYAILARACPKLRSLTLPVEIPALPEIAPSPVTTAEYTSAIDAWSNQGRDIGQNLRSLRLGVLPDDDASVTAFFFFLLLMFPSILDLDELVMPPRPAPLRLLKDLPDPAVLLHYCRTILPDAVTAPGSQS